MEPRLRHNLDELLKVKGLRASDLSKITGIPKQTLSEWRAGLVPKSVIALKRVASAFDISLDELIFKTDVSEGLLGASGYSQRSSELVLSQTLESLASITPSAVFASDARGFCLYAARTSEKTLGRLPSECEGRPWVELVAADAQASLREFLQTEKAGGHDTFVLRPDLSLVPTRLLRLPIWQENDLIFLIAQDEPGLQLSDERRSFSLREFFHELSTNFEAQPWVQGTRLRIATVPAGEIEARRRGLSYLLFSLLNSLAMAHPQGQLDMNFEKDDEQLAISIASSAELATPLVPPQDLVHLLGVHVESTRSSLHISMPLRAVAH